MKEIKFFVSQPMRNKTNEEIKEEREKIIASLKTAMICSNIVVIDSFFENATHDAEPLWFLGEAIKLMSEADLIVFTEGWEEARGCKIEHQCAKEYGKNIVYMENLWQTRF